MNTTHNVEDDKRRFRGVGELERTGYIPAGSAAEREARNASSVQRERVTETETAELIRLSDRSRFLELGFGPSGAWLQPGPQNDWAREQLRRIRSA